MLPILKSGPPGPPTPRCQHAVHSRWRSHSVGPQLLFSGLFIIGSVQRHKHADIKCTATHLAAELPADRKWVLISNLASKLTPNYKERPVNVPRLRLARQICVKGCWTLLCKMMRLVNFTTAVCSCPFGNDKNKIDVLGIHAVFFAKSCRCTYEFIHSCL